MQNIRAIAFTHHHLELPLIGKLHLDDSVRKDKLSALAHTEGLDELMYISTCNRVAFIFTASPCVDTRTVAQRIVSQLSSATASEKQLLVDGCRCMDGDAAVRHMFEVASSLDSLVVGEREIITQIRTSFEQSKKDGLTGHLLQVLVKKTIETAKQVFSETRISARPVSIVSLAWRKLRDLQPDSNARALIVGSGKTNTALARFMKKNGFRNFTVYNRTLANAEALVQEIGGKAVALDQLAHHHGGFDILVTCTGAADIIITPQVYRKLLAEETDRKIVVDLAIPADTDASVLDLYHVKYIGVQDLKGIAERNLREREGEMAACQQIIGAAVQEFENELEARKVELAMRSVPEKVREIRKKATETVFSREISGMDAQSREILEKVLEYMEKKYISVPMKLAREIIVESKSAS
jgi:glutamyl-tRNA reductase